MVSGDRLGVKSSAVVEWLLGCVLSAQTLRLLSISERHFPPEVACYCLEDEREGQLVRFFLFLFTVLAETEGEQKQTQKTQCFLIISGFCTSVPRET